MERIIQFLIFLTVLYSVFGLMQWYLLKTSQRWFLDMFPAAKAQRYFRRLLFITLAGNLLFISRFFSIDGGWHEYLLSQYLLIYPGGVFFGTVTLAFLIVLLTREPLRFYRWITRRRADTPPQKNPAEHSGITRKSFLKLAGTAAFTAPLGITTVASAVTAHDYRVIRKKLYYPGLPSSLEGFRMVHLSDIHSGIYMTRSQMRDIFQLSNEQHPHLVAITGDFVDNSVSEIPALHETLAELKADYGVFGCLGNHDHYASAKAVSEALTDRGVQLLNNSGTTLAINGEALEIAGVDDAGAGRRNFARPDLALNGLRGGSFRMLLSHRPDLFDDVAGHNVDLMLAGHTHGGQIGFEGPGFSFYPIDFFHQYSRGLYEKEHSKLYVNVGIGMVGVPVRLIRPELTVLELTGKTLLT